MLTLNIKVKKKNYLILTEVDVADYNQAKSPPFDMNYISKIKVLAL